PFSLMKTPLSRRDFIGSAATAGAGMALGMSQAAAADKPAKSAASTASSATTAAHSGVEWPISDQRDENALIEVLRSGKWGRTGGGGARVKEFEALFAQRMGAKHCIATSSGTTALLSAIGALNIGP